jgi:membrane-bound acyltransferase YfiQ involved in biofilm formation
MLDSILEYSIYFSLGFLAARHYARYATALDDHRLLFIGVFGLTLAEFLIGIVVWPGARNAMLMGVPVLAISKLCLGCSAILALHSLVRSPLFARSRVLLTIGLYTFAIYLMNTIAIGVVKGSLLRLWSWDGVNFLAFAPVLVLAGILIPIAVKRIVLSRVMVLDRMTG